MKGVAQNMKRYADIGIEVEITELDIKCPKKTDGQCKLPWNAERLQTQANVYTGLLKTCLEAENCKNFQTWGLTDKYSWLPEP